MTVDLWRLYEMDNKDIFKRYEVIADMIVGTFGSHCETIIHDFSQLNSSLIYINGNVTGRKVGAPITNIILQHLKNKGDMVDDMIGFTTRTKNGKFLKSSITFIRDEKQKVIGCLGVNFDITAFATVNQIINEFTKTQEFSHMTPQLELYENNIEEIFETMIDMTINQYGIPVAEMRREDKKDIVQKLDSKGVFLIQGSMEKVAHSLNVSKQTIYNYLDN